MSHKHEAQRQGVADPLASPERPRLSAEEVVALLNGPAMEEIIDADEYFYNGRRSSGEALYWYNRQLLEELPRLPRPSAWHEIGGGAGLLPIALGMMGHDAVNIDHYHPRLALGERILARMNATLPGVSERVRMVEGSFPDALDRAEPPLQTRQAFAVTTNFAGTYTTEYTPTEQLRGFLGAVRARYAGYVFDVCLLCGNWREADGWRTILALAADVFGCDPQLLFTKDEDYARYYFADFRG